MFERVTVSTDVFFFRRIDGRLECTKLYSCSSPFGKGYCQRLGDQVVLKTSWNFG